MDSEDLSILIAVQKAGSFSGAATRLGVAVSTVARRVDALEAQLKLRLLERRTKGVTFTKEGEQIASMAGAFLNEATRISRAAAMLRDEPETEMVRVSATEFVISELLAPMLHDLWSTDPTVRVALQTQRDIVSLAGGDADLAIRMAPLEGNSLIARKLPAFDVGLFASAVYLDGREAGSLDLRTERLLTYDMTFGRLPELEWVSELGLDSAVAMKTGSTRALLRAAEASAGIAVLPRFFARAAGLIEIPMPSDQPIPARVPWLLTPREIRNLAPVQAVHAWIVRVFEAAHRQ